MGTERTEEARSKLSFIEVIPSKECVSRGESLNILGGAVNHGPDTEADITVWGRADEGWKVLLTRTEKIRAGEHKHLYYTLTPEMIASANAAGEVEELELIIRDRMPGPDENGKIVFIDP